MEKGLFNITSATTTTLVTKGKGGGRSSIIRITNIDDPMTSSGIVYVSLYLDDDTNQTYFFKKRPIFANEIIELNNIAFDSIALGLKLKTEIGHTANSSWGVNINVILK